MTFRIMANALDDGLFMTKIKAIAWHNVQRRWYYNVLWLWHSMFACIYMRDVYLMLVILWLLSHWPRIVLCDSLTKNAASNEEMEMKIKAAINEVGATNVSSLT